MKTILAIIRYMLNWPSGEESPPSSQSKKELRTRPDNRGLQNAAENQGASKIHERAARRIKKRQDANRLASACSDIAIASQSYDDSAKSELNPKCDAAILCDTSTSMESRDGDSSRIELLHDALDILAKEYPSTAAVVEFNSIVTTHQLEPGLRFQPSGYTLISPALEAAQLLGAKKMVVITDGRPGDSERALNVAKALKGISIHAIFVGDENDRIATSFLERLCAVSKGVYSSCDLSKYNDGSVLAIACGHLLGLPDPQLGRTQYRPKRQ